MSDEIIVYGTREKDSWGDNWGDGWHHHYDGYDDYYDDYDYDYDGGYEPTASDSDGDGVIDEIVTTATRIPPTPPPTFDWTWEFDFSFLDQYFEDLNNQITNALEDYCQPMQAHIDTLSAMGIDLSFAANAAGNSAIIKALGLLGYAAANFGNLSVSNSVVDNLLSVYIDNGDVPEASISLSDILSGAGSAIEVRTTDGNPNAWDADSNPGYHEVTTYLGVEHIALDQMADALASTILNAAEAAGDPMIDQILNGDYVFCDLSF